MDFNADGKNDILLGCFEGYLYIVYGKGQGNFSVPEKLLDKNKEPLQLGEFWDYKNNKWGETQEPKPAVKDICIYPLAIDWDGDGDLDILMGGYRGVLGIRINEGNNEKFSYASQTLAVQVKESPFGFTGGASPAWVDWDGDGLKDILCGYAHGGVVWFKNSGDPKNAKFEAPKIILNNKGTDPNGHPWSYLKIDVEDFNGDQKLDLLVGANDEKEKGKLWVYLRR